MDGDVPPPATMAVNPCDAIVLCCVSESHFKKRLVAMGSRPVLLTTRLKYTGSFLLRDSLPVWAKERPLAEIRQAAGTAYAINQKISKKTATGVFALLPAQ